MINPDVIRDRISVTLFENRIFMRMEHSFQNKALFERGGSRRDMIASLIGSGRKCKNPTDYYYGIAGVFDISLTDGLSFLQVEKEFFSHVKKEGLTKGRMSHEGQSPYKTWYSRYYQLGIRPYDSR